MTMMAIFILVFTNINVLTGNDDNDVQKDLGKSHFSPTRNIEHVLSERSLISVKVAGLDEILKVIIPNRSFFTSILASTSSPRALETWKEIVTEAKRVKQSYDGFYDHTTTNCYITNVQSAFMYLIQGINDNKVKRSVNSGDTSNDDSNTDSNTNTGSNSDLTDEQLQVELNYAMDLIKKLKTNVANGQDMKLQINTSIYHSIRVKFACWTNKGLRKLFQMVQLELYKIANMPYSQELQEKHKFIALNELRKSTLELVRISVNGKLIWPVQPEIPTDLDPCDEENNEPELSYEQLRETEEQLAVKSFCTSTPAMCIGNTPRQTIRKTILQFGVAVDDAIQLMQETDEATIYRKALELNKNQLSTYTLTQKLNYGEKLNIDFTILSNKFKGGYSSDETMKNLLYPLLNELKFLNIVYATDLKHKNKPLSSLLFNCDSFKDTDIYVNHGKIYSYSKNYTNKYIYEPMPFCHDICKILESKAYIELEENKIGMITKRNGNEYGFIEEIKENKPICAMQKSPTDMCMFNTIPYAQQISIIKTYVYHCMKKSGCNYYLEGKFISAGFISTSEFKTNFETSETTVENSFFEDDNEVLIKGLVYSFITAIIFGFIACVKRVFKSCKNHATSFMNCSCCRKHETSRVNNRADYTSSNNQQEMNFLQPKFNPNAE